MGYRPALDGVRGMAVLLVVACHLQMPGFAGGGTVGVTMFFVLSGFLITSLLLIERRDTGSVSLRAFYRRRILRLAPALVAMVLVLLGASALFGGFDYMLPRAALAVTYTSNFISDGIWLGPFWHTWSLATEEQFYIVWPALMLAALAVRWWWIAVALVAAAGVWFQPAPTLSLLAGCALAFAFMRRPIAPGSRAAAAALGVLAVATMIGSLDPLWTVLLATLPAVVLIAYAATARGRPRLLRTPPLIGAGKISYGLYLWHLPVIWTMRPLVTDWQLPMAVLVAATISLLLTLISYRYVERPFLRMKSDRGSHHDDARATGPTVGVAAVPATTAATASGVRGTSRPVTR